MATTRRKFIQNSAVLIGASLTGRAVQAAADPFPPLPPSLSAFDSQPDFFSLNLEIEALGTAKPTDEEQRIGAEVLADAPFNTEPVAVASYFAAVGTGGFGTQRQSYVRGWPIRYNPVIVNFFSATRTNPLDPGFDGDATNWCAAFVNWCIARAASKNGTLTETQLLLTTRSASSGSFRCWHQMATQPKRGDIVVWKAPDSEKPCPSKGTLEAKGHVAFFISDLPNKQILVVGGNQRVGNPGQHAVTEKSIARSFLAGVHSIRSVIS